MFSLTIRKKNSLVSSRYHFSRLSSFSFSKCKSDLNYFPDSLKEVDLNSRLSFTPANFGFNAGMHVRPTDGADVNQLPHHMPVQNFGSDYPVPIGTSYPDMELMVNLHPGRGVMTRKLDPSPNQPGFPGKL